MTDKDKDAALRELEERKLQDFKAQMEKIRRASIDNAIANEESRKQAALGAHRLSRRKKTHQGDMSDWEAVDASVKNILGKEANTINSSAPNGILGLAASLAELTKAVSNDMKEHVWIPLGSAARKSFYIPAKYALKDRYNKMFSEQSDPISAVVYSLSLDKDNKLVVDVAKSDEENGFNDVFKKVVECWLDQQGYKKEPDDTFKPKAGGATLTQADFEELKKHSEKGIQRYLETQGDLEYQQAPGVSGPT